MANELFVDGILGIAYGKGAVRVDFFTLSPDAVDAKGQPARERSQRLVMTTEVFRESVAMLQGVLQKLDAQGAAPLRPAVGQDAKDGAAKGGSPSPNF